MVGPVEGLEVDLGMGSHLHKEAVADAAGVVDMRIGGDALGTVADGSVVVETSKTPGVPRSLVWL
jgi:hypothetical protein